MNKNDVEFSKAGRKPIQITILSRAKAKHLSVLETIPSCVILSINSTDEIPNRFFRNSQIKAVAHYMFNDVESGEDAITDEQANNMASFVKRWADKVDVIIVHCTAGVSRSGGVGAAIMLWATGSDSEVFDDGTYRPNMRCYRKMLNALMMDVSEKEIEERLARNLKVREKDIT